HKDVPPGVFVGGNPMRLIYTKEQLHERWSEDPIYGQTTKD
ncbi:MAG: acetyltransferase, partial [Bacillota bacterium]|nr:acetyltransferase [Bacillota bacterium]